MDSQVERQNQAAHSRRVDRSHLVEADSHLVGADSLGHHQAGRRLVDRRVADHKPELRTRAVVAEVHRIGADLADQVVEVHSQLGLVLVDRHLEPVLEENLLVDIRRDCLDLVVEERRLS